MGPSDSFVAKLSNQLEDAGWLGLSASAIISMFLLAEGKSGATSGTDHGFVWTKKLGEVESDQEFDFGIGKIKVENALFTGTMGVYMPEGHPINISFLLSFFGGTGNPSVFLEIDPKIAVLADKIVVGPTTSPPAANTEDRRVIGYENLGDSLNIPLPFISLEFNFEIHPTKGIISSIKFYNAINGLAKAVRGIFSIDLDRVMVFPKLGNLGLYVDQFFLDLSSDEITPVGNLFPEVYDPAWKGMGAKEITFLYPIDEATKEFIAAGVQGFLIDFNGLFSGSFNFDYTSTDPEKKIRTAHAGIEIRNNEFVKADLSLGWDLKKALEQVETDAEDPNNLGGTADEANVANLAQNEVTTNPKPVSLQGVIEFNVAFVWYQADEEEILGFDLIMRGITLDNSNAGFSFNGTAANAIFWSLGFGFGIYQLAKGVKEDKGGDIAIGVCLLYFILMDIASFTTNNPVLPRLEQVTINKLGFRFVRISTATGSDNFYEVILGLRTKFTLESGVADILNALANLVGKVVNSGEIFGQTYDSIKLEGDIDLEFDNLSFSNKALPSHVQTLFEQRDTNIIARKIPEIKFEESASEPSSFPKPIVNAELIIREKTTDTKEYGLALKLQGLTSSAFKVDTPAVGIVAFFHPDFGIEFLPQLEILPKFSFIIPKVVYAEGTIDIGRPIPGFGGTQNKISLDVGVIASKPSAKLKEQMKIEAYKYRFGGEVVWGEATHNISSREYDFLFVQVFYEGETPLLVIGLVGLYGLGLIFGRNIRPGVQGEQGSAMGIANWIIGEQGNGEDPFKNIKDWPAVPAADGSTWHPSINFDPVEEIHDDQYAVGLTVKVGSPDDGGEKFSGEVVVLVGFPEFWLAIAGIIEFKKINSKLTVVIVYDRDTFAIKVIFEISVKDDGSVVAGKVPLEFGTAKSPKRTWFYLGHYLNSNGGPVILRFLKGIFSVKAYLVVDTQDLVDFGLLPFDDFGRPTLPGTAFGFGVMLQIGPKKYGPSFANIELFAALGLNVGVGTEPTVVFGEIYAGGYIKAQVLFIKLQLELLAILAGIVTDDGHRFQGLIKFKVNLPWPIPDVSVSFDFVIQSADFLPLPDAVISTSASGLYSKEALTVAMFTDETPTLPIDGVLSISFDKPIYEILNEDTPTLDKTSLLLNDENPDNDKISESIETEYQGIKYLIHYVHVIEEFKVEVKPIGGGTSTLVSELAATWEVPALYTNSEPDESQEGHLILYLNALFPPTLQFSPEALGEYHDWQTSRDRIYPCTDFGLVCLFERELPLIINEPKPNITFNSVYGNVILREENFATPSYFYPVNIGRLGWSADGSDTLVLPLTTFFELPYLSEIELPFQFAKVVDTQFSDFTNVLLFLKIELEIRLRGKQDVYRLDLALIPESGNICKWRIDIIGSSLNEDLIDMDLTDTLCENEDIFSFLLKVNALDPLYPLHWIKIKGPMAVLQPRTYDKWGNFNKEFREGIESLFAYLLRLKNICINKDQHTSGLWEHTEASGDSTNPEDIVDSFSDYLLLEPNREYTVNYAIRSFASIYHIGEDGTELVQEKESLLTSSADSEKLKPITFQTESTPSQNISRYLGFTFPSVGMQAPYPDALVPMITFKNQGLIRKIYEKHYGEDVLQPKLVDIDGNEIRPELTDSFSINSGGSDSALEELLGHCLPDVADYLKLQVNFWKRELVTGTPYSLQLKNNIAGADPVVPFTVSFTTSKYPNMTDHVAAVNSLLGSPDQVPVLNSNNFGNQLQTFFGDVIDGSIPSYDEAIERFYRDLLGNDGGKLGENGLENYVGLIVALGTNPIDPDNETWAAVIELSEPLIGKEGVSINLKSGSAALSERGVLITQDGYCIIRDFSGSRIIICRSNDGINFTPLPSNVSLNLVFDFKDALKKSIASYVANTFVDKTATDQESYVNDVFAQANTYPDVVGSLTQLNEQLIFNT